MAMESDEEPVPHVSDQFLGDVVTAIFSLPLYVCLTRLTTRVILM